MGTLCFPVFTYEAVLEYYRLRDYYSWLAKNPEYFPAIYSAHRKYGVSMDRICAIIQEESGGRQYVVSHAGAISLMQVMKFHNNGNREGLFDIHTNIDLGTKYYKWCLNYAKGNEREALRFYNAGPFSNRERYNGWPYVDRILAHTKKTKAMKNEYFIIK